MLAVRLRGSIALLCDEQDGSVLPLQLVDLIAYFRVAGLLQRELSFRLLQFELRVFQLCNESVGRVLLRLIDALLDLR